MEELVLFETSFTVVVPEPVLVAGRHETSGRLAPELFSDDLRSHPWPLRDLRGRGGLPDGAVLPGASGNMQGLYPAAALRLGGGLRAGELAGGVVARGCDPPLGELAG